MRHPSRWTSLALWTLQALLAALFLFAGGFKLVAPVAQLQQGPIVLPLGFLRFIGVMEVLGGLGLVLPGLFRVRRELTAWAAAGLVTIMAGATTITLIGMGAAAAAFPAVVGVLALAVCLGRGGRAITLRRETPHPGALAVATR